MQFRTEFQINPLKHKINYKSPVLLIGSCFSEEIGNRLSHLKFRTLQNPSGIIYNPVSLANELNYYSKLRHFQPDELFNAGGIFRHFDFHSSLAHPDKKEAIKNINQAIENGHQFLLSATHLIISFGTSIIYKLKNGKIVANNHKQPADNFDKMQLTVTEIISEWNILIEKLLKLNPNLQIIFTISPVRHIKDGMVENQISKSTLHLAINELIKSSQTYYFPSYELMMDDLRDYRFYKSDLIHPNEIAVDYIFEKFSANCIDSSAYSIMDAIREIQTAKMHKPFFPETEEHMIFKKQMFQKAKALQEKHPEIDLGEEIKYFSD